MELHGRNLIYLGLAVVLSMACTPPASPETTEAPTSVAAASQGEPVKKDVPYVPTPMAAVDEMLRIAEVREGDVVYDLGCGDGRIVIAAAKQGARGIGVDIDPARIRESNENAKKEGVTDKVRFVIDDLFKMDFKDATVVTLYLLPDINVKLRPRLLDELRPGTRIVSHDFDMRDWTPDQRAEVKANGRTHRIYYWIIPAKVGGTWTWTDASGQAHTLDLTQKYQMIPSANLRAGTRTADVSSPKMVGDRIMFKVGPRSFEGRVEGDKITGNVTTNGTSEPWNATRKAAG